jgi:hypothetical protein
VVVVVVVVVVAVVVVVVVVVAEVVVVIIKFTGKYNKTHETDNKAHTQAPRIYPYAPK